MDLMRRLLRRRRVVLVDEAAWRYMTELAVLGAAAEVVETAAARELRWLSLETEDDG